VATTTSKQRRRVSRKAGDRRVVRIEMKDHMGHPRWITADLIDNSEAGLGISLMTQLETGSTILIRGNFDANRPNVPTRVGVKWCEERDDGTFRAGLEFLDES
jgi:hypothetical protein